MPHQVAFICTNREILGIISKAPNKGKQAPFVRVRDDYSGADFNTIMRLRELLVTSGTF